jgi:tripartite-type tricarboxylate transporter receptor subunit TctC
MRRIRAILVAAPLLALAAQTSPTRADPVSDFYAGNRITFNVGTTVGGGFDLYARILAESLPNHIPGKPSVLVENMGGAGGVKAANYVYNVAAKDGTVIGMPVSSIVLAEALRPSLVKFQSRKFGWVGTITTMTDVLAVYRTSGVNTIEDAKKKSIVIGATGKLGTLYLQVALVNALLGTKFRIVPGYKSGNEANLAMDSGEIQGRTNQWISWRRSVRSGSESTSSATCSSSARRCRSSRACRHSASSSPRPTRRRWSICCRSSSSSAGRSICRRACPMSALRRCGPRSMRR